MNRTIRVTLTAAALVVTGTAAVPAAGMQAEDGVFALAAPPNANRAESLRAQAEALYSQPRQWRKAVRLLEQSAQLRTASDPEAYTCWLYAARLRASLHDYTGARQNLERAAAHAMARGAVIDAAHAYIDAVHVALRGGQLQQAQELAGKATLLATSPQLDPTEVAQITARLRS
jgi:tetratricopeptide (TPR) repeat protein